MATQAQLDSIRKAYYQGVTQVSYKGRTVTYRSIAEMRRVIDELETALGKSKPNSIAVTTSRGY